MEKDPRIHSWAFNKTRDPAILLTSALLLTAAATAVLRPGWWTGLFLLAAIVIWGIILYFFRDPDRAPVKEPGLVVGPADGVVVSIEPYEEEKYLKADTIRVSMFLSIWNVHVQRAPLAGVVKLVDHQPGKFLQAFKPEASDVNEYIAMIIETGYGPVMVKQISGIMARRCVNFASPGDELETGMRFGHIKFGSRVDLFLPSNVEVLLKVGEKVRGGLTRIAQMRELG
jgi:phosphatidylserine decarboxylase